MLTERKQAQGGEVTQAESRPQHTAIGWSSFCEHGCLISNSGLLLSNSLSFCSGLLLGRGPGWPGRRARQAAMWRGPPPPLPNRAFPLPPPPYAPLFLVPPAHLGAPASPFSPNPHGQEMVPGLCFLTLEGEAATSLQCVSQLRPELSRGVGVG